MTGSRLRQFQLQNAIFDLQDLAGARIEGTVWEPGMPDPREQWPPPENWREPAAQKEPAPPAPVPPPADRGGEEEDGAASLPPDAL